MNPSICELIEVVTSEATDGGVRLTLYDRSAGQIVSLQGEIRGPRCVRARTLAATFSLQADEASVSVGTLITDPCYWTPALPFLYEVTLQVELADGSELGWQRLLGVKRWEKQGASLFRERRRVVLRGTNVAEPTPEILVQAMEAEVSLLVAEPSEEFLTKSSELGVSLMVDMRGRDPETKESLTRFSWYPAVEVMLFDDQPSSGSVGGSLAFWSQRLTVGSVGPAPAWAQVVGIELNGVERPPAWLSACNLPVIAMRRGQTQSSFFDARLACDRLQSDLAPEFNLAGYFV